MQPAYSTPAVVPTYVDMLAPKPPTPGGNFKLLLGMRAALLEVVVPRFATDGDFEPPHPETSSVSPARIQAGSSQRAMP
jgi:hypothetical protein